MNLGVPALIASGTVVFFKQNSSMKKIGKILFSYVLFILLLLVVVLK
jgi:Na+/phosphate symporter